MLEHRLHFGLEVEFETRGRATVSACLHAVNWMKSVIWQQGPATSTFPE